MFSFSRRARKVAAFIPSQKNESITQNSRTLHFDDPFFASGDANNGWMFRPALQQVYQRTPTINFFQQTALLDGGAAII